MESRSKFRDHSSKFLMLLDLGISKELFYLKTSVFIVY